MNEGFVPNVALTLRVLFLGGVFLILPRITRRGLLFGAYVGEALANRDAAHQLLTSWYRGCAMLMGLALSVGFGISLAGWPVTGNLTGTAVLLMGGLVLYVRLHSRARALAPPTVAVQAEKAVAPLDSSQPKGVTLARFALGVCLVASLATFVYALGTYEGSWSGTSFLTILFAPSLNLLISPITALMALLTARAKRSFRGGGGGRSAQAQQDFRAIISTTLSWAALLSCGFMTLASVQIIRFGPGEVRSFGPSLVAAAVVVIAVMLGNLIRIVRGHGQGGSLREEGSVEAPLTDGLADNTRWVWGLFYVDRSDPSIMVEKRFGIGYTLNLGNRAAQLILGTFLVLCLGLIALVLYGTLGAQ